MHGFAETCHCARGTEAADLSGVRAPRGGMYRWPTGGEGTDQLLEMSSWRTRRRDCNCFSPRPNHRGEKAGGGSRAYGERF